MNIVKAPFNQECEYEKDMVKILDTWEAVFGDRKDVPTKWEDFDARLGTLVKTLSLGELIEALEKGKFYKTLKALYTEIIKVYNSLDINQLDSNEEQDG